jgi:Tfp pilus assembly protein PilO
VNVGTLDRKNALRLLAGVAIILFLRYVVMADRNPTVVGVSESVPMAERRLERLRQIAATVPGKETLLKEVTAELSTREQGMLKAETGAQAQAQLADVLHTTGAANGIDIRGMEDWRVKPLAKDYGEVSVTVRFTCKIEQLVNFLASLANVPQLLSTNQIAINGTTDPKNKSVQVRLSLSGVVSKKIAEEKKTGSTL